MNWVNFRIRKPMDGQRVMIYTTNNEMHYCVYDQTENEFVITLHDCCDQYFKDNITHWASPQPPEIE